MTVSLDLVKVTSAFLSKVLTRFSLSLTTATHKASFIARKGVRLTSYVEDGGNFGVTPWLGKGIPWGMEKAGKISSEKARAHLLLSTHTCG